MAKQGGGSLRRLVPFCREPGDQPRLSVTPSHLSIFGRPGHNALRAGPGLRNVRSLIICGAIAGQRAMTGSSEFTTWVALAGAAIVGGLCALYSSNPWVLIAAALIGALLGYKGEQIGRRYLERYLSQRRSR